METAVIGLGLIGGSLLRALAAARQPVAGFDADPGTRDAARAAAEKAPSGAGWRVADSIGAAVARAGLVVLAVPLPALDGVLAAVAGTGYAGLVTDVTSVKAPVRDLVGRRLPGTGGGPPRFVGGHPMAGRETSGFASADPALFAGCAWVLCLEPGGTALPDWLELARLVTSLGARAVPSTAAEHDRAVATVSHVPHLLATALAEAAAGDPLAALLAAGSFRDGTRVAASSPDLVAAMCGGNAASAGPALDAVLHGLRAMRAVLDGPEPVTALRPLLTAGHAARRAWPPTAGEAHQVPATVDVLLDLGRTGGWVSAVAADRGTVTTIRPVPPLADGT